MPDVIESIAYLTAPDGTTFQVLDETGQSWNEAATHAALEAYMAAQEPGEE